MAYIPGFEHAIFISYAHLDNIHLSNEERGWIDLGWNRHGENHDDNYKYSF
jgi:hypothetical protein